MKQSTQQLLLLLGSSSAPIRSDVLRSIFFSHLSDAGFRSMQNLLIERGHIINASAQGQSGMTLTESGQLAFKAEFPALARLELPTEPEWRMVLFLHPPKADPGFRYLRRVCGKFRLLMLARGVYLSAGKLPFELEKLLISLYAQAVTVIRVGEWEMGAKKPIVARLAECQMLSNSYSGISKEIQQLLSQIDQQKTLMLAQKLQIGTIFARYYHTLKLDAGVCEWVYAEATRCDQPLLLFAQLCQNVKL